MSIFFFFFNDPATTEIYTLSLHDALPISTKIQAPFLPFAFGSQIQHGPAEVGEAQAPGAGGVPPPGGPGLQDPPEQGCHTQAPVPPLAVGSHSQVPPGAGGGGGGWCTSTTIT